jgi:hypothetical protein
MPRCRSRRLADARVVHPQEVEELPNLMIALRGVPHSRTAIECVVIPPSLPLAGHIAGDDEVRDDPLRRALRYSHGLCDVAQPGARIALQAEEYLCVARDKAPGC